MPAACAIDRKSTRLNSSHSQISYAVFCLKKKKFGCGVGLCGACTVHVNGQAMRSCVTAMRGAAGKEVTTIVGLDKDGLHPVQMAWMEINVPQCGYCQVGQIMQAAALLNRSEERRVGKECRSRWSP